MAYYCFGSSESRNHFHLPAAFPIVRDSIKNGKDLPALSNLLLTRLDLSPQNVRVVVAYFLSFVALGAVTVSLGPALPFLADRVGVSIEVASGMFSAKALGFGIGSFFAGRLIEKVRAHGMLQVGLGITALTMLAVPFSPEFALVLAFLLVAGIFAGTADVGINILIVWQMKDRVGPYMSGLHFLWGFGALLSPLIIVQLHRLTGDLVASFAVIAALPALCIVLFLRLPSPPPIHARQVTGGPLALRPLAALMALMFLAGVMELSMSSFIFTYVYEGGLGDAQQAGWVNSSFYAALTATRLILAFLLLRFSNQSMLGWALILVIGSCAMVLILPKVLSLVWIGVVICGVGQAAMFPLTLSMAPQYLPAEGRVTSFMFGGASIGFIAIPWMIGRLFESRIPGSEVIWYAVMGAAMLFAVILLVLVYTPKFGQYTLPAPQPAGSN